MELEVELRTIGLIAAAMGLGAVIGFEREYADKPAGIRTHMLIAGGSALLVILGNLLVKGFAASLGDGLLRVDPMRLIEAIVAGVAFLGAGTIIRREQGSTVNGLTTGATMLFTAAIGICVAVEELLLAVGVTALALLTLRVVYLLDRWIKRRKEKSI